MSEKLTEEEKLRFKERTIIARNDPTAYCNKLGPRHHGNGVKKKPVDVLNGQRWLITPDIGSTIVEVVFAERFFDVRAFAVRRFGGVARVRANNTAAAIPTRWRIKWSGSALDPRDPPHVIVRDMRNYALGWQDVRDLDFKALDMREEMLMSHEVDL